MSLYDFLIDPNSTMHKEIMSALLNDQKASEFDLTNVVLDNPYDKYKEQLSQLGLQQLVECICELNDTQMESVLKCLKKSTSIYSKFVGVEILVNNKSKFSFIFPYIKSIIDISQSEQSSQSTSVSIAAIHEWSQSINLMLSLLVCKEFIKELACCAYLEQVVKLICARHYMYSIYFYDIFLKISEANISILLVDDQHQFLSVYSEYILKFLLQTKRALQNDKSSSVPDILYKILSDILVHSMSNNSYALLIQFNDVVLSCISTLPQEPQNNYFVLLEKSCMAMENYAEHNILKQLYAYIPTNYDSFYQKIIYFIIKMINVKYKPAKSAPKEIESIFFEVLFKIVDPLQKIPFCLPHLVSKLIEIMCKIFLQSISSINTLPSFDSLWHNLLKYVLVFVEKGKKTKEVDIINIALENIKNIIRVMQVEKIHPLPNEKFWAITWKMLEDYFPKIKNELKNDGIAE